MHPNQIQSWKKQLVESAEEAFTRGRGGASDEREREIKALHAKIDDLTIGVEYGSRRFGGTYGRSRTLGKA